MPDFKILAAAFPTHCFCLGNHHCTVSRHGIWQPFFCLYAKQYNDMKNQTSGTLNVPASGIPAVGESVNALTEQVNNLKKLSAKVCGFKKNPHLCSAVHLIRARRLAIIAAGIFCVHSHTYSSVPCGALMRPLPLLGVQQRGAELFLFPSRNSQHIVSF